MIDVLESLRRPEYTGANRCPVCTVGNVVLAVLLTAVLTVGIGTTVSWGVGVGVGIVVLVVAGISIWLRGYLVPYTPTLTKRYLPAWVHDRVGPSTVHRAENTSTDREEGDGLETQLVAAGVLEPCESVDDLCPSEEFAAAWDEAIDHTEPAEPGTRISVFARALGVNTDTGRSVTVQSHPGGDGLELVQGGRRFGQWPSETALRVDRAAATVLPEWLEDWDDLSLGSRLGLLRGVRLFLRECPGGGGPVTIRPDVRESCCTRTEVVVAVCTDTDERLVEHPITAARNR